MSQFSIFVGLDVHKNSISVAEARRHSGEPPRFLKRLPNDAPQLLKLLRKLGGAEELLVCYEAGPTGYGLCRRLRAEGIRCEVVAPAKTPRQATDRVKTDRRDAVKLADFLRSGHLTAIRIPTEAEEGMRDLIRAREDLKAVETNTKRRLGALLLRHGRVWHGKSQWTKQHLAWVGQQSFEQAATEEAHRSYLTELLRLTDRIKALDTEIARLSEEGDDRERIHNFCALKGVKTLTAATILSEVGDFSRFPTANQFMSFLGLTPSESSSGDKRLRGPITKAGNRRLRRLLVEAAWAYRRHPHVSRDMQRRSNRASPAVREIAWAAQNRLYKRLNRLSIRGKSSRKALVAVARELAGFVWAIGRQPTAQTGN